MTDPRVVQRAFDLLAELVDGNPCRYDHDDYCQTHYHQKPCAVAEAVALLKESE